MVHNMELFFLIFPLAPSNSFEFVEIRRSQFSDLDCQKNSSKFDIKSFILGEMQIRLEVDFVFVIILFAGSCSKSITPGISDSLSLG